MRALAQPVDHQLRDAGRHRFGLGQSLAPLREARIEVMEVAGKPGGTARWLSCRPHFQLDELFVSLRLVAELPASSRK